MYQIIVSDLTSAGLPSYIALKKDGQAYEGCRSRASLIGHQQAHIPREPHLYKHLLGKIKASHHVLLRQHRQIQEELRQQYMTMMNDE
jgi:hypothetical protein